VKGREIQEAPAPKVAKVVDIMEALRNSLANKKATGSEKRPTRAPPRKRA